MAGMKIFCRHCHEWHVLFPGELASIISNYQRGNGITVTTRGIEFDCILFIRDASDVQTVEV